MKKTVLVVDDHRIVSQGVCSILCHEKNIESIQMACSASEALAFAGNCRFDIFILDVELPDMSGFDLLQKLQVLSPDSSFIFHTMHEEMWVVKHMMAAGADAIVLKTDDTDDLRKAVAAVASGDSYYSERFERYCKEYELQVVPSDREIEILRAIADGHNSKYISDMLFISANTVEFHRKRLFRKLGATNMAELIMKAVERGLLCLN